MRTLMLILTFPLVTQATDWSKVACPSDKVLAREMLRLERRGSRLQKANPDCLKGFSYFSADKAPDSDGSNEPDIVLEPGDLVIPKSIKRLSGNSRLVKFEIIKKGTDKPIKDSLVFKINKDRDKEIYGCASPVENPNKVFVDKSCLQAEP